MKRAGLLVLAAMLVGLVSACGGEVDEELLPTRVPTLDASAFVVPTVTPLQETAGTETETPAANTDQEASVDPTADEETPAAATATTATDLMPTAASAVETPQAGATPEAAETVALEATADGAEDVPEGAQPDAEDEAGASEAEADTAAEGEAATTGADVPPESHGVPAGVSAAMATADTEHGQQLTVSNACTGCHALTPDTVMVGPSWYNLAQTAATRVEGQSAEEYLYTSIAHPNDYVVEGFLPNLMIQTYEQVFSEQDFADIIAYLLTLEGDR